MNLIPPPDLYLQNLMALYDFHIHGSRFFANKEKEAFGANRLIVVNPNTDWDLFGEYGTGDMYQLIHSRNWDAIYEDGKYIIPQMDARDPADDTRLILRHKVYNIEIVFRNHHQIYKRAIEALSVDHYWVYGWKSSPMNPPRDTIRWIFGLHMKAAMVALEDEVNADRGR